MAISKIGSNSLNSALTFTGQQTIPTINLTGGQITFPATQVSSSDANTLDDYEEGTWTVADTSGAGLTLTSSSATYTKIGRMVYFAFDLGFPSTANTNTAKFSLPLTPAVWKAGAITAITVGYNTATINADVYADGNGILFYNPSTLAALKNSDLSAKEIAISGWYQTS